MASSCTKRFCTNEGFIIRRDADSWSSELIRSVGLYNISEVFSETQVLQDLSALKDCKPASVSNWSFDENCLFCCLRREKVKEHVVALNKQIVESGGKPLLGKDPSHISRLERQAEEFLDAVLHRKEYTPKIPDPHIPVVACGIVQQMINELASYYTSRKNSSQDTLQNNGKKDQSLVKPSCVTSSPAVKIDSVASAQKKFIMVDQDAPLDLSLRKVKVEDFEQDGVLDLSTKKNLNKGHTSSRNSHVSPATNSVKRDSIDLSLAEVKDLQSVTTLEEFTAKLCFHHQRQIVDALGFLQSEVNTLAPSKHFQALTADLSEKQATTSCSYALFETRSEIQRSARTCSVDAAVSISKTQESSVVRTSQKPTAEALKADVSSIAPVMTVKQVDLDKTEVLSSSSCGTGVECGSSPPKSLVVTETTADNLVLGSSIQQVSSSNSVKKCLCSPGQCLPTCTAESDHADLSKRTQKCSFAREDVVVNTSTVQKTVNIVSPVSPRTARKSRKGSCLRQSNGSLSCLINDPDSHCDLVFIRKSITECQPQSRSRLHPRQNARKSTRGHKYVEEYLEVKTVRTLARKSIGVSNGNYPAHMSDLHTLVIPKQVLSASGSVPLVNTPFAGDCMKNVIPKLSSEQIAENEMPGDVVKVTSLDLMVETSQTGKSESNGHILSEPSGKQSESTVQPDLLSEALSCTLNAVVQEMDMVEENTETTELTVQKEGCGSQMGPMPEEVVCGTENKAEEDRSLEPSPIPPSPNMAKECSTDEVNVEQRNERHLKKPTEVETAADVQEQSEASEIKANSEEDGGAQGQGVLDTESNLQTANSSELPVRNQGDSVLTEVSSVQPLVKCQGKDTDVHSSKVLNAKHPVSSERCLRSRSSKASVDVTKESVKCGASDPVDHANDKSPKTHSTETNVHTEQEPDLKAVDVLETAQELPAAKPCNGLVVDHAVQTRPKSRTAATVGRDNHPSPGVQVNNNDLSSVLSPEVLPETVSTTSTTESGKHNKLKSEASESTEKMPLRNKSSTAELSVNGPCSPSKKSSPSSENMLLRSRSNTEGPSSSKSISPTEGHSEKQGQTPLRIEQATNRDLSTSSEAVTHMPLRSRTVSSVKPTVTKDSPVKSSVKSEQPVSSHSGATCKKPEANGHMPLRSSGSLIAEQPRNNKSAVADASESPGRMSLRRGNVSNTEKLCGSTTTTPSRNKRPLKQQRVSTSSSGEAEESLLSSKLKIQNEKSQMEAQLRGSLNLPDESFRIASLKATEPVVCSPPKFLEALRGEEHQQLISNLNSKFDKMHKSWVPLDKEGQPAPKPKNKADRLKEIWKSKRRARKSRPLEQQKLTAVQMLFMKPFDLPSICRWFLQSTETKSLVIVKKVNTRLPSETQLCFHTSAAGAGSSHGIFPSLQAERLKKHLKKFAIASPVKNNPKNQRLLSKALGQGISAMRSKEKHEPTTATRICTKAQSLAGAAQAQAPESLAVTAGSAKNPASARILRKYSNMREKLQVQQNKKCKEKTFKGARLKAAILPKKADKQKLTARKAPKSVVQRISSLTKTAKTNSALKQRALKRNPCHKDGASPKRLQALKRMTKAIGALDKSRRPNTLSKKRTLIKTGTNKAQQMKASLTKVDTKKTVFQKGPSNLESQSSDVDVKPLTLEDQVLTRSQRKMEGTPSQTGSPKSSTKRGLEPLVTPSKRTRTSKP